MKKHAFLNIPFGLLLLCAVPACGRSLSEVRGTVVYDGVPVKTGSVQFIPGVDVNHPKAMINSCAIKDGQFHLAGKFGVAHGTYHINVSGYDGIPIPANPNDEESREIPYGKQLFPEYTVSHLFEAGEKILTIEVPKTTAKSSRRKY